MLKLLTLLAVIGLSGCTQGQRFMLMKNAQLDECAMKRMSETQISGQIGYLQAHQDCHHLVNVQKGQALQLESVDAGTKKDRIDAFEQYELCWSFVKDLVIDQYYPDLRLPEQQSKHHTPTVSEQNEATVTRNFRIHALPDKLSELNKEKLIMVRESMQSGTVVGNKTRCAPWDYHELESIVGREIHRRYPHGINSDPAGNL